MSSPRDNLVGYGALLFVVVVAYFLIGVSARCFASGRTRVRPYVRYHDVCTREAEPLLPRWKEPIWPISSQSLSSPKGPVTFSVEALSVFGPDEEEDISPCTTPPPCMILSDEETRVRRQREAPQAKIATVAGTTKKIVPPKRLRPGMLSSHLRVAVEPKELDCTEEDVEEYITETSPIAQDDSVFIGKFNGPQELKMHMRRME